MKLTIYGIKNCDTMQKAMKWLEANNLSYHFHNYKTDGLAEDLFDRFKSSIQLDQLINTKSATFKELDEQSRQNLLNPKKSFAMVSANTSVLKRPILELNGKYIIGFKGELWGPFLGLWA
jgi:arsenate reductase